MEEYEDNTDTIKKKKYKTRYRYNNMLKKRSKEKKRKEKKRKEKK